MIVVSVSALIIGLVVVFISIANAGVFFESGNPLHVIMFITVLMMGVTITSFGIAWTIEDVKRLK